MYKLQMQTPNLTAQNIDKIAALFPNCITEMLDEEKSTSDHKVYKRGINFELLKQMLSPDVVDGDEAHEFTWVGKKASIVEANKPIRKTLRPCPEESKNWDDTENLYIEGDNLEVLKLLQESNPVLGFGLGRFGGAVAMQNKVIEETKDFSYFYMDNYYLKTLVEMGYLGLAFFILLLFGLVLWSLRSIGRTGYTKGDRTRVLAVSMFAGMCGVLVHCYFENIFEVPYMMAYFWSMAAAVMYLGYFRKRKN